jgi:hypothetical protein
MAIAQIFLRRRGGNDVSVSQSRKWLTERMVYSPQVRLVFDQESPQLAASTGNFEDW